MTVNSIYKFSKRASFEIAGDQSIVMIDDVGETYRCNNTLTELLKELDGERSIIEISHRLRNKYNCIDDMIVKDLRNVASDLCEIGILESV